MVTKQQHTSSTELNHDTTEAPSHASTKHMWVLNPRADDFFLALSPLDQRAKGQNARGLNPKVLDLHGNAIDLRSALSPASRPQAVHGRVDTKSFQRKSGSDARNGGHSSRAGAVRMGPSALYRRTGTVRSSVRSPHIVGSQRSAPRRHHCRPAPRFCSEMTVSAASAGRPPSLWVAAQRVWPV